MKGAAGEVHGDNGGGDSRAAAAESGLAMLLHTIGVHMEPVNALPLILSGFVSVVGEVVAKIPAIYWAVFVAIAILSCFVQRGKSREAARAPSLRRSRTRRNTA